MVEVVHATRIPLILRQSHELELPEELVAGARRELLEHGGYLLGVHADGSTHPACLELAERLRSALLGPEFALSFFKAFEGDPPEASEGHFYEGPHLDTHPALTEGNELLRLLVNLSPYPRRFAFADTDRWQLTERCVRYGRSEFVPLELPAEIEMRETEIPGRSAEAIHALRFLASAVPHVGLNDPPEHFLVSFETLTVP